MLDQTTQFRRDWKKQERVNNEVPFSLPENEGLRARVIQKQSEERIRLIKSLE